MKVVNSSTKPITSATKGVPVMLRICCRKFNFSIIPVDDFKIVVGMEFIDHVHAFPLLATNFLSIIIESKACMVSTERAKSIEKTLSAMRFKKAFKKNLSFQPPSRS